MHIILAFLLAFIAVPASAQALFDPTQFVSLGMRISSNVDKAFLGQVWDNSSPILKRLSTRVNFVAALSQKRLPFGAVTTREWTDVSRLKVTNPSDGRPLGDYVTVTYVAACKSPNGLHEQLIFYHDLDGLWRLAGYQIQ